MGKHLPTDIWCTHTVRAAEFVTIQTTDRGRLRLVFKSGDTAGQNSTRIKRDTAKRLLRELADCLEATS